MLRPRCSTLWTTDPLWTTGAADGSGSVEAQFVLRVREEIRDARAFLDLLGGTGGTVDDGRDGDDLGTCLAHGLDRGERGAAGGGGVLDDEHAAARDLRA